MFPKRERRKERREFICGSFGLANKMKSHRQPKLHYTVLYASSSCECLAFIKVASAASSSSSSELLSRTADKQRARENRRTTHHTDRHSQYNTQADRQSTPARHAKSATIRLALLLHRAGRQTGTHSLINTQLKVDLQLLELNCCCCCFHLGKGEDGKRGWCW